MSQVIKPPRFPVSPMEEVAVVILDHLQQVFQFNYENKNWYLNPKTQMYIRADYPEIDRKEGFKPGFVLKSAGGLAEDPMSIGDQSWIAQDRGMHASIEGFDSMYSGNIVLRAVAEIDNEAGRLAFLGLTSINRFREYIIGREGIVHVHCSGFGEPYPYEAGSYSDAFACDLQVGYSKREAYGKLKQAPVLEKINLDTRTSTL